MTIFTLNGRNIRQKCGGKKGREKVFHTRQASDLLPRASDGHQW